MLPNNPVLFQDLASSAELAINGMLETGGRLTLRPTGEVSAVRTLTLDGFNEVAHAWEPLLASFFYSIELNAVFTHSRPHVTFTHTRYSGSGRCELADLLVVIDHQRHDGTIDGRRAALVQAKRLKTGKIKLSGSDWTQHELLLDRPPFRFAEAIYAPNVRDLNGPSPIGLPDLTAEYGGVEVNQSPRRWSHWLPKEKPETVSSEVPLGHWLAGAAMGRDLLGREADPVGADDWSALVEELLRVTGALPIVKRNEHELRRNHRVICRLRDHASYLGVSAGLSAAGSPKKPDEEEYWPEGPISIAQLTFRQIG